MILVRAEKSGGLMDNNKYYNLTKSQQGVWNIEMRYPNTSINTIAGTLIIKRKIDNSIISKYINELIKEYDIFRLRMKVIDNEVFQYKVEYSKYKVDIIDFTDKTIKDVYEWQDETTRIPINILGEDLFKFFIIKYPNKNTAIYIKIHHILSDAWSLVGMSNKILNYIYSYLDNNILIENKKTSYLNFIEKEQEYLKSKRYAKDEVFWINKFADITESNKKYLKSKRNNKSAKRRTFVIKKSTKDKISRFCKENRISMFTTIISALAIFLKNTQKNNDIIIGTPVLNRLNAVEKETLGLFINILPLRIIIDEDSTFMELNTEIMKEIIKILKHQRFPYLDLIKNLRKDNNKIDDLYEIAVSYQNAKLSNLEFKKTNETRWHFNGSQVESLYIHINDRDLSGNLIFDYDYHEDVFTEKAIDFMHEHILNIILKVIQLPNRKISDIEYYSSDKGKIVNVFNDTDYKIDTKKSILNLIDKSFSLYSDDIALIDGNSIYTYKELNNSSNKIASFLLSNKINRNEIIALYMKRSAYYIISILGIMKAKAVFMPISIDTPLNRIEKIIKNSNCNYIITNEESIEGLGLNIKNIFHIKDILKLKNSKEKKYIDEDNNGLMSYIMHTSGSTGTPKGVIIGNDPLYNFVIAMQKIFNMDKYVRVLALTSISFDISILELLSPLAFGCQIINADESRLNDSVYIYKIIKENNINFLQLTPSRLKLFLNFSNSYLIFKNIKYLLIGGEELTNDVLKSVKELTDAKIFNMYGPTETTIWSTYKEVTNTNTINIGRPIINTKIHILNEKLIPVPIGVVGEIYISGSGLSKGYINNSIETKKSFIKDINNENILLYKTGDLGRWYPKGDIEYIGRVDNQVKVRGYRIELNEIRAAIIENINIVDALVLTKDNNQGNKELIAYLIHNNDFKINELKLFLSKKIPKYMMPYYFRSIKEIPMNTNGKVDVKKLHIESNIIEEKIENNPPENKLQKEILDLWREILKKEHISINDNFFNIGGESISIIKLQLMLEKSGFIIEIQDLYRNPTIKELSYFLKNNNKADDNQEYIDSLLDMNIKLKRNLINNNNLSSEIKGIFLTGATGFLGIHILDEIIKKTDYKVYCLIRPKEETILEYFTKIIKYYDLYHLSNFINEKNGRIILFEGDIIKEGFGVNEDNKKKLIKNTSHILHCAADVSYFSDEKKVLQTNREGTKRIVDFAMNNNIHLLHMSSLSVSGNFLVKGKKTRKSFSESDFYILNNLNANPYVKSKIMAEEYIYNKIEEGLNANIIRIGLLTGRFRDGHFQINLNENMLYSIIKGIFLKIKLPKVLLKQYIDLTPVDICAEVIVKILIDVKIKKYLVFHISNKHIMIKELIKMIHKLEFYKTYKESVSTDIKKIDMLNTLINSLSKDNVRIISKKTFKLLNKLKFKWNKTSDRYIIKILNHIIERKFI